MSRAAARSPTSSSLARTRSLTSAAALSVNVIARIDEGDTPSSRTARTKRSTSTAVLPLPAPAASSSGSLRRAMALSCSALISAGIGTRWDGRSLRAWCRSGGAARAPRAAPAQQPHALAEVQRGQHGAIAIRALLAQAELELEVRRLERAASLGVASRPRRMLEIALEVGVQAPA